MIERPSAREVVALLGWLLVCFSAAAIGSWATFSSLDGWYPTLIKPAFNPPNWIFGPVWTMLYAGMAVAAWFVWRRVDPKTAWRGPLALFMLQLSLNVFWSALFFGLRRPDWSAVEIVVLWLAIAATAWSFRRYSRIAFLLMMPYLAWVSFAAVLNFEIWRLNR